MRTLKVFESVSLDGCFVDGSGSMDWAHTDDPEWRDFTASNAATDAEFLFGRVTYDQMAAWWPTDAALAAMPEVAARMNERRKVVASRTMEHAEWAGTRVIGRRSLVDEVRELLGEDGPQVLVMGSGSVVAQLVGAGLVDRLQLVVVPIVLGSGRSLFEGVDGPRRLELMGSRSFSNGNVVLEHRFR